MLDVEQYELIIAEKNKAIENMVNQIDALVMGANIKNERIAELEATISRMEKLQNAAETEIAKLRSIAGKQLVNSVALRDIRVKRHAVNAVQTGSAPGEVLVHLACGKTIVVLGVTEEQLFDLGF